MRVHPLFRRGLRGLGAALLGLASAATLACGTSDRVPTELLGVWKTKESRHADADAFFEIRPASLMLGIGHQPLEVLEFDDLEIEEDGQGNQILRFTYPGESGNEVLVVTQLRGRRAIRIGAGEGTWYPSRSR
jgi:hypothetical protein